MPGVSRGASLATLSLVLVLVLGLASPAPVAAASLDGRTLRFSLGAALPENTGAAPWLAVGVGLRLGRFSVEPELGFWIKSETAFGVTASAQDLHAGLNLAWSPVRKGRTRLLLAGGGAAHMVRQSNGLAARDQASETTFRPGVQALLGVEHRLSPRTALFLAARLDLVFRQDADDELEQRYYGGVRIGF
jgi:hypothetical protein